VEKVKSVKKNFFEVIEKYRNVPDFYGVNLIDIDSRTAYGDQIIHMACVAGNIEDVGLLIDAGADLNSIGENGFTPLHYAVEQNNIELTRWLLKLPKINKNAQNSEGYTPRDLADLLDHAEIKELLDL
jgi:uncharacterized protein